MEEMRQLLFVLGVGIPAIVVIGLFMIKKIISISEDVASLKESRDIYHPKK